MADTTPNLALAMNLPPARAVEYFNSKGMRITSSWRDIEAAAHARAFTVAGVLKGEVLQDIRSALDDSLAKGETFDQFLKGLKPKLKAKGWWGQPVDMETGEIIKGRAMTPHRLRTVYQTNIQSAYMAGRYKAQLEDADQRPYWQYVAILDSRTRPRHRALAGRIFRYDDPAWASIYPPNGYNCRCRVKAITVQELRAEGGAFSKGEGHMETVVADLGPRGGKVPVTGYRDPATKELFAPDPGFDSNPGQGAFGLDVALARRTQEIRSPEIRSQVWQALNNSPLRQAQYRDWVGKAMANPHDPAVAPAQVVGFLRDDIAEFFSATDKGKRSISRVAAHPKNRFIHADSEAHAAGGIALTEEQYATLPGIVAAPDRVFYDTEHANLVLTRDLADGGVIYLSVTPEWVVKKVGTVDALVNAYHLPPGNDAAGRLIFNVGTEKQRFRKMGKAP